MAKAQSKPETRITPVMIERWMGSDNLDADSFLELLAQIANREYPVALFRDEVIDYSEETV